MDEREFEELIRKIADNVKKKIAQSGIYEQESSDKASHQRDDTIIPISASSCNASESECTSCGLCVERRPEDVKKIIDLGAVRVGANTGVKNIDRGIARMIDHTLLKPDAKREDVIKLCKEAKEFGFAGVCVNPSFIPLVVRELKGTDVIPVAVVGFPLGATSSASKSFEAREAVREGAQEIDMVINVGALKSKDYRLVYEDIKKVVEASVPAKVKVIIETALLTDEEKIIACALSKAAGAAYVKTSTGFGPGGAKAEDVRLMRRIVGEEMGVKASGGIRSYEDAKRMVDAGATRIGASASVAIVTRKGGGGELKVVK